MKKTNFKLSESNIIFTNLNKANENVILFPAQIFKNSMLTLEISKI